MSQPVSHPPFRLSHLSQMSQLEGYRFEIPANCPAKLRYVAVCSNVAVDHALGLVLYLIVFVNVFDI